MSLIIVFTLFAAAMALSLVLGISMLLPLALGLVMFGLLAFRKGCTLKQIVGFCKSSLKDSFIVITILLLIGCLTGLWRQSGTVAYFVTLGVSLIPPRLFLAAAFLLAALMSYALGTSFGVTATAGVILISIARAGGVSPVLAAAAIFSGVYVGDRGSPAASSAHLVAVLTHTDIEHNVRDMLRTSWLPFLLSCALYLLLSFYSPMQVVDGTMSAMLAEEFSLKWFCLIPAVLMILLPFCRVKVKASMIISLAASFLVCIFVQGRGVVDCLSAMLLGYRAENEALNAMLSGGGMISMLEVSGILLISGTYGEIFKGSGILDGLSRTLNRMAGRIGRYPVMLILSFGVSALFCNQTIGAIMQSQLAAGLYDDTPQERQAKMLDIENTVIVTSGLVPWCIASSVPLAMLGADIRSLLFAFYLWLIPLCYYFTNKNKA